jgi:transposase, IS30 family
VSTPYRWWYIIYYIATCGGLFVHRFYVFYIILLALQPVDQCLAELVSQATISLLKPFAKKVLTITADNGKEFANHAQIAESLKAAFYFAHPYSAWERGTNENTNGLVRQYFPKNTNFLHSTFEEVLSVTDKLNHRPRKCLDFLTPFEVFLEPSVALVS